MIPFLWGYWLMTFDILLFLPKLVTWNNLIYCFIYAVLFVFQLTFAPLTSPTTALPSGWEWRCWCSLSSWWWPTCWAAGGGAMATSLCEVGRSEVDKRSPRGHSQSKPKSVRLQSSFSRAKEHFPAKPYLLCPFMSWFTLFAD